MNTIKEKIRVVEKLMFDKKLLNTDYKKYILYDGYIKSIKEDPKNIPQNGYYIEGTIIFLDTLISGLNT